MEMKRVGIDADGEEGWQIIARTGGWRSHVVKTMLNEIVKTGSAVASGHQRKHVLLASVDCFSLAFPSKLCLTPHSLSHLSFP